MRRSLAGHPRPHAGRRGARAALAAWTATLLVAAGTVLSAQPAAAGDTPCNLMPKTLNVTTTPPASGYDRVVVSFTGTLPDKVPGETRTGCVEIPASPGLPLRGHGKYVAKEDPDVGDATVGTMVVDATGIRFVFDDGYLDGHDSVTFQGTVTAGVRWDKTTLIGGQTITWEVFGKTVTVTVPPCDGCLTAPDNAFKWAGIDPAGKNINAQIWIGTEDLQSFTSPVTVNVIDYLGPGQRCHYVSVNTLSQAPEDKPTNVTYGCSGDSVATATFTAQPGTGYFVLVDIEITDPGYVRYEDKARITAGGSVIADVVASATWESGSASGGGHRREPETKPGAGAEPGGTPPPPVDSSPPPVDSSPTPPSSPEHSDPTPPAPEPSGPPPTQPGPGTSGPSGKPLTTPEPGTGPAPWGRPPAPKGKVWRAFQVDRYAPTTAAQARLVARLDDDRRLGYREDRGLWGASSWQFVTVLVPVTATPAELFAALNAQTLPRVGDLTTTRPLGVARPGRAYVVAWELGRDAAPVLGRAWGPRHTTPQNFVGRG